MKHDHRGRGRWWRRLAARKCRQKNHAHQHHLSHDILPSYAAKILSITPTAFSSTFRREASASNHATVRRIPSSNGTVATYSGTNLLIFVLSKIAEYILSPTSGPSMLGSTFTMKSVGTCTSFASTPTARPIARYI